MNEKYQLINAELDPVIIFEQLSSKKDAIILESQNEDNDLAQKTIIVFEPEYRICYQNQQLIVNEQIIKEDPLEYIDGLLKHYHVTNNNEDFCGGFVGAISYDYGLELLEITSKHQQKYPQIIGGIYQQAIMVDHLEKTTTMFHKLGDFTKLEQIIADAKMKMIEKIQSSPKLQVDYPEYNEQIKKIKDYIKAGDIYEINYTIPYFGKEELDMWTLYKKLREDNPVPYAAYLNFNDFQITSTSPELFFELNHHHIRTQPMKGTAPRGTNEKTDMENKKQLTRSEKDRSELLMIIDLMRNDISKICKPHSVEVKNPFQIKEYPTVFQQVSDVCGILKSDTTFGQIIKALFPSGSITGAPKKRSMEIIDELEIKSRNFYTGAIGYYSFNQNACLM